MPRASNSFLGKGSYFGVLFVMLLLVSPLACSFSIPSPIANSEALPEIRAIWVQLRAGSTPQEADRMLERAVRGNFNTIIYCVGSGVVAYKSELTDLLDWASIVTLEYDPLAYIVEQAHAADLNVFVWWCPGLAMTYGMLRDRRPEWDIATVEGIPDDLHWLNFSLPEAQRFVGDVVLEIVNNYAVEGIHLDYIRYPSPPPYNEIDCANFFPPDAVSQTVAHVYERLKVVHPDVVLTAAVKSNQRSSATHLQNWADWLEGDYIDRIFTMAYFAPDETYARPGRQTLEGDLRQWQTLTHPERIVPGLRVTYGDATVPKTAEEFMAQLNVCKAGGFDSFSVFDEQTITSELLEALADE